MPETRRQLILLFCINFLFFMGVNSMNILPAYLVTLGASPGTTALFSSVPLVWLISLVLFQLIRGRTLHKLRLLRVGFISTLLAMTGMLFFHKSITLMFPFYLLTGITYGAGFTNLMSMMYDIVPVEKRHSSAATFGISGLMTSGIASLLVQWVYRHFPPHFIFFLPMGFSLCAGILTLGIGSAHYVQTERERFSFRDFVANPQVRWLALWAFVFGGGFGIFKNFMPLFTQAQIGEVDISRFFSFFSLVGILFRLFFAKFLDRISKKGVFLFGFAIMTIVLFLLGRITELYQLYLAGAGYGLAHSLLFPTFSAEFVQQSGEQRAAYNNIFLALFNGGTTLFASTMGLLANHWGLAVITPVMTVILLMNWLSLAIQKPWSPNGGTTSGAS